MAKPDPLQTLWITVGDQSALPTGWAETHAPGGDLTQIWHASESPAAIYGLGGIGVDRARLVEALLAAARLVAELLPDDDPRPREALSVVERWVAGTATAAEVRQADDAAMEAWHAASRAGDDGLCVRINAVLGPALVVAAKPSRLPPTRAVASLDCAAIAVGPGRVAAALRGVLPCPSLATVLAP